MKLSILAKGAVLTSYLQSAAPLKWKRVRSPGLGRRQLRRLVLRPRDFRLVLLKVNISFFPLTRHGGPLIVPERFANDGVVMPNCRTGST
jgi:hypothetical protein